MNNIHRFENFISPSAQLSQKKERRLKAAKHLLATGQDAEVIRKATRWSVNPYDDTDALRFENISDIKFKDILLDKDHHVRQSTKSVVVDLKKLIKNTSLFKEYPVLDDVVVELNDNGGQFNKGGYVHSQKKIVLNGVRSTFARMSELYWIMAELEENGEALPLELQEEETVLKNQTCVVLTDEHKSTLVHEIQHIIQWEDDLPLGANPAMFRDDTVEDAYGKYYNAAGEIEAREAQYRRTLTQHQRQEEAPFSRSDLPKKQQSTEVRSTKSNK